MSDLGNKEVMARNIKKYLQRLGKNQKELCEALGFKETTVSSWMSEKSYPRIDKIEKMAKYFGIKKADLIEESTDVFLIKLHKKEVVLVEKYRKLDASVQEDIDDYVDMKLVKENKKLAEKEGIA